MFEVLLQAEKALASGALDQAERSYWQLIVLDPTNAIAVAGLARVSLDRRRPAAGADFRRARPGDRPGQLRRKADRRDPGGARVKSPASDEPDLPLLAAHRLEALGRRRAPGQTAPRARRGIRHAPPAAVPVPAPAAVPAACLRPWPFRRPCPRPCLRPHPCLGRRLHEARRHIRRWAIERDGIAFRRR